MRFVALAIWTGVFHILAIDSILVVDVGRVVVAVVVVVVVVV